MSIRLIASDLDGTLLTNSKEFSEETDKALKEAISRGIQIVPATGRSYQAVPAFIKNYPGIEYIMTANGGAVYSVSKNARIYQCLLNPESVEACIHIRKTEDIIMEVFINGVPYSEEIYIKDPAAYGATEYGVKYIKETRNPVQDICAFAEEHKTELDSVAFVCKENKVKQRLYEELDTKIPDVYVTSSVPNLVEVGHINAGKGKTLSYILKLLDISPEETAAFGDADNDCSMLEMVKYGVAVGNATEKCKKSAVSVTETNEKDGVAKAIFSLMEG